jgi:hypothetical protein
VVQAAKVEARAAADAAASTANADAGASVAASASASASNPGAAVEAPTAPPVPRMRRRRDPNKLPKLIRHVVYDEAARRLVPVAGQDVPARKSAARIDPDALRQLRQMLANLEGSIDTIRSASRFALFVPRRARQR